MWDSNGGRGSNDEPGVPRWASQAVSWLKTSLIQGFAAYALAMYPCLADPGDDPTDDHRSQFRRSAAGDLFTSLSATNVVPFARPRRMENRFSSLNRMEILRWSEGAQEEGYVRFVLHAEEAQNDPEIGEFLFIHRRDRLWATWAVGCSDGGFLVWHPGTGRTIGWFPVLREALGVIVPSARQVAAPQSPLCATYRV